MDEATEQFLELIRPLPGYRVLDVTSHCDALSLSVAEKLAAHGGSLSLVLYPGDHEEPEAENIEIIGRLDSYEKPFKSPPRAFDVVMVRDVLDRHLHGERMIKLLYSALANAGFIIIIQPKGLSGAWEMMGQLERCEFRAANTIEIFKDADLVMAKKLHMWGNGL